MIEIAVQKTLHGADGEMQLDVALEIEQGEFVALSGKSGSGKTTLLRIIAGLEASEAYIKVDETVFQDKYAFLKVQKRGIGFVFQDFALFDNMSLLENLLYVKHDREFAEELLRMSDLDALKERSVTQLSGGQKQRVSLCRAMMNKPKLLLLDEPFSALDKQMRQTLQQVLLRFHKKFGMTTIMVSHDSSEIYHLATRMIVLDGGKVLQNATPKELLLHTSGSQKLAFEGEILDIYRADILHVVLIVIGQQIVEVVVSKSEYDVLKVGDRVEVSAKAFWPTLQKI